MTGGLEHIGMPAVALSTLVRLPLSWRLLESMFLSRQ